MVDGRSVLLKCVLSERPFTARASPHTHSLLEMTPPRAAQERSHRAVGRPPADGSQRTTGEEEQPPVLCSLYPSYHKRPDHAPLVIGEFAVYLYYYVNQANKTRKCCFSQNKQVVQT